MKNKDTLIRGDDLMNLWQDDNCSASEHNGSEIDSDSVYLVRWADHVSHPKYDRDCTILGEYSDLQDALAERYDLLLHVNVF